MKNRQVLPGKTLTREVGAAIASVAFALLLTGCVPYSFAQQQRQQTFHSAQEAGSALFAAAQNDNERALLDILGLEGNSRPTLITLRSLDEVYSTAL